MSTHQSIDRVCVAVLILTLLLSVLFINGEALGIQVIVDEDAEANSDSAWFTAKDLDGEWDSSQATVIALEGKSARISGAGAYAYDGGAVITNGGSYVLTGTLEDGSIVVDAYASSKVWILLNGVTVNCSDDACLIVDQADKVFLTLAEGSENSFTSGDTCSEEALADNTDGVIFSHDDLTINGSGTLRVTGGWKHGIAANDDLVIAGGSIIIEAVQDALHANDSLRICNADLTVSAGDDGIATSDPGAHLYLESGNVEIRAQGDGINTSGDIDITGGTLTIVNKTGRDADGIDSNGDILISGGVIRVSLINSGTNSALDFASENGGTCEITGGDIIACGNYSMAEGFDSSSTQCSILYNLSAGAEAGTTVSLEDADGNILLSYEVPCSFSSVNLSCPALQLGESYLMVIGDNVETITLEETAASYGDAQSGMFGGAMNWGGMQNRGNFGGFGRGQRPDGGMQFGSFEPGNMPEPPDGTTPSSR